MTRPFSLRAGWLTGLLLFAVSLDGAAADRALLIGVGEYANPALNLSGIDLDLEQMDALAEKLGFKERKRLRNAEATTANVERQIEQWLIQGTGPGDRALIYFSGHGSRIPDENGDEIEDQADEVLVMHEAKTDGGKLTGVLVDDRIHELLRRIPAGETLVLIDACNSGTATKRIRLRSSRSGVSEGESKFLFYAGMPETGGREVVLAEKGAGKAGETERFVGLSAAADNESALASPRGSLFTRAIAQALDEGAKGIALKERELKRIEARPVPGNTLSVNGGAGLTLEKVHARATELVAQFVAQDPRLQDAKVHHPQLNGNLELARKPLRVRVATQGGGTEWGRLRQFAQSAGGQLKARAQSARLEEGDLLQLEIEIPDKKGYLNILMVDAEDRVSVLFPNKIDQQNQVTAGTLQLPGPRRFDWTVRQPFGPALVLAFFTRRPLNLYDASNGERDDAGKLLESFPPIDSATTRSVAADPSLYAAVLEVSTCEELRQCK